MVRFQGGLTAYTAGTEVLRHQVFLQVRQVDNITCSELALYACKGQGIFVGTLSTRHIASAAVIRGVSGVRRVIVWASVEGDTVVSANRAGRIDKVATRYDKEERECELHCWKSFGVG